MMDVRGSDELKAVVLVLSAAQRDIRNNITKEARQRLRPVWQQEVRSRANTALAKAVLLPGAGVSVTGRQVTLRAATRRKPLRGGLIPATQWPGVELGMRVRQVTYSMLTKAGSREVTRRIGTQFRNRVSSGKGTVVFPAADETGQRLVAMMVRSVVDSLTARGGLQVRSGR